MPAACATCAPASHARFGFDSARKHGLDCRRLDLELPALRTDVDDDESLLQAVAIGVGTHTAAVLNQARD